MPFLAISAAFAYLLNYLANDMEKIQKCTLSIIYENYFTFGLDSKLAHVWLVASG